MASSLSTVAGLSKYFQAFSLVLISIILLERVDAQNRNEEVYTLLRFKQDNLLVWDAAGYWSDWKETDPNACSWSGVTCTKNYTVGGLDLSSWASLWPEGGDAGRKVIVKLSQLSNLTDLSSLDLSYNNIYAVELGNLTTLTSLDLSNNLLEDFPGRAFNLTSLIYLDLSFNSINSYIEPNISVSTSLRYISFQHNQIYGEIPHLAGLTNLQFLLLAENNLSGAFPQLLGINENLALIDLSNNFLSGSIPSLPNVTNLVHLKLDNNNFTGFTEPWHLVANSTLRSLTVSYNQLEGRIPSVLGDLLSLENLNMSSNRLSGTIPSGFSKMYASNRSPHLDLSQNLLLGNIPTDLLEQANGFCASVNLSHNLFSGSIPIDAAKYSCFDYLDLSYNNLSGPIPLTMFSKNDSSISTLLLQNNSLSGDIVDIFIGSPGSPNVGEWRLQNNLLTGDLSRLANTTSRFDPPTIDLRNNKLQWRTSGAIPDPITATFQRFASNDKGVSPQEVLVAGNNFSGTPVPKGCFNTSIQVLDLSNSYLTGEMLAAAFSGSCLPNLKLLNLSNNAINGSVPEDIFELPYLEVLDLSHNNLSGSLPRIPISSSFFNPEIFAGNDGLCGLPLDPCPEVYPRRRTVVLWWVLVISIGGLLAVAMGSCLAAAWLWRVYQKRHEQDADLIKTLLERDAATLMRLREIRRATNNFAKSAQIGEGGFGIVYKGKLQDGTVVAIKRSKREESDKDKQQFLNEVRILSQVNHRNLVKLMGCCLEKKIAVLVLEYVSNGTLQDHLRGKTGANHLSWKQRLKIAVQTANALNYLHASASFPIYHRDVKSANILLNEDLDAKVADFGISRLAPLQATHVSTRAVQGTLGYIDPEYYLSCQLTDKSDVFSFGVVLLEIITAKPAIDFSRGGDDNSLVYLASPHIERGDLQGLIDPSLMETYCDPVGDVRESILNVGRLATRCVEMQSKSRPTMNEVLKELQHLWVELNGKQPDEDDSIIQDDQEDSGNSDDSVAPPAHTFSLSSSFSRNQNSGQSSGIELSSGFSYSSSFMSRSNDK
ncbi:unnamed protein product [Calypogeia fissa]